ncbi:MAG: hypothetical protein WC058_15175 [Phycisphaeraceae bacterium]
MPPTTPAQRANARPRTGPRPRKKSSGGIGPLFYIMGAIVLAVIVTAVIVTSGQAPPVTTSTRTQPGPPEYKSVKVNTKWPQATPWHGLEVGISRAQVLSMFGKPNIEEVNFALGHERLEFHDDPTRAGIFGGTGGTMLTVFIDNETQKVLFFIPPGGKVQTIR